MPNSMPGKRAPGQKMITFWADDELLAAVESARKLPPRCDRSEFIRRSIISKLRKLGYAIDEELALGPDRASKVIHMPERHAPIEVAGRVVEKPGHHRAKPKKKR
jgi:hypothetical protein